MYSLSTSFLCTHSFKSPKLKLKPTTEPHCFARLRVRVPSRASSRNDNANTDSVEAPSVSHDSSSSLRRRFRYFLDLLELLFFLLRHLLCFLLKLISSFSILEFRSDCKYFSLRTFSKIKYEGNMK